MRFRSLLVVALLTTTAIAIGTAVPEAAAAPAGCTDGSSGFVMACEQYDPHVGPRGAIGLVGDSVLLGSNNGMSNPGLPTLLTAAGWGPARMSTSLGMRTRSDSNKAASAYHVLGHWKAAGFNPTVIVVNLGANHILDCAPASVAICTARIDDLLNRITALYPKATVWWAKTLHETYGKGTGFSPGMLGWNAALDHAAATHPNLVVWDWPNAVATSNPVIQMDRYNVHPVSGVEYVKRSNLIVAHLLRTMPAYHSGPSATLPAVAGAAGLEYYPAPPTTLYSTVPADVPALAPGVVHDIALGPMVAMPTGAAAVAVTVSASGSAAGTVTVYRCGSTRPLAPSVLFGAGQQRSAQAIVRLGAGRHLCVSASTTSNVVVWLQGTFARASALGNTLTVLSKPVRTVTPTVTVPASGVADLSLALPSSAQGAALSVTVMSPTGQGTAVLHACGTPVPGTSHVSFSVRRTTSAAAFVPTTATSTRRLCARIRMSPGKSFRLAVDVTGLFRANDLGARFRPAVAPKRLLDTRDSSHVGGWYGRHVPTLVISIPVAPAGAAAATGNLQMVGPLTDGRASAYGCSAARPNASAVTSNANTAALGGTTARVSSSGRLCVTTSANTNTVFDLAGWWVVGA